jgi:hypothetical protein
MTELSNSIYETEEWPKDFAEVTMIAFREEATSYKMQRPSHNQPYGTYSEDSKDT